jgi:hypothetical protein
MVNRQPPQTGHRDSASWFYAVLGGLLALTLFLPGEQTERTGAFHLPCILWLLTAAVWTIWPLLQKKTLPGIRFSRIDFAVYAFFTFVCLSILWNLLPGHGGAARPSLNMLSVWFGMAAAWFLLRQIRYDAQTVTAVFGVVLAVMLAQAILGLHQQFIGIPNILRQFNADPGKTIAQIDASIKPDTPDWDRLVSRLKTAGPMGTYPMTNSLGGLLGCWFIFLLGFLILPSYSPLRPESVYVRWGLIIMTGIILVCFVLTKCRSGIVAVAVGLALLAFLLLRRRLGNQLILAALAVAAVLTVAAFATSGKSLVTGAERSLGFRLEYWQASLGMIQDTPVFGCGSGNFKQTYTRYKLPQASEEVSDPHNFVIEIAAVSGLPALLLFVTIFVFIGAVNIRAAPIRERKHIQSLPDGRGFDLRFYGGGLFGCWLAFFLSFNTEAGMDFLAPVFTAVTFPVVGLIFRRSDREIPLSLIAVALTVLCVHLLAAGGVSVTSTAICLWLFAAVLAHRQENTEIGLRSARIGIAVFLMTAIVFVHQTGLKPILGAASPAMLAEEESDGFRRIALLRQAVQADPWSSAIRERLAAELFQFWLQRPGDPMRKTEMLEVQRQAVRLMPRSATLRFVFAERLNFMFEKTGNPELKAAALEYYHDAIELYPNFAKFRAPYALLLWKTAGESRKKQEEALRQRDLALQFDGIMPHADQKLTPEQRLLLDRKNFVSEPHP